MLFPAVVNDRHLFAADINRSHGMLVSAEPAPTSRLMVGGGPQPWSLVRTRSQPDLNDPCYWWPPDETPLEILERWSPLFDNLAWLVFLGIVDDPGDRAHNLCWDLHVFNRDGSYHSKCAAPAGGEPGQLGRGHGVLNDNEAD